MEYFVRGRENIARAVGRAAKDLPALVKDEGLPAWKDGEWRALSQDLMIWSVLQADKFLPSAWGEIRTRYQHLVSPSSEGNKGG